MADHLQSGYRLNDYETRRVLRRDSDGFEYEAFCLRTGTPVSIKEYFPEELADRRDTGGVSARSPADTARFDAGLARFLAQHRTLGRIDHPVVVNVRECLSIHGTAYSVMDLPDGKTLEARLEDGGPLTEDELASIFGPMLEGLEAAHRAGLLHREINPENILIRPSAPPVLLRFGAPPPTATGPRQVFSPRTPSFLGSLTPGFAALEQYSHRGHEGPWTDIYSLGAVMYRCVVGTVPVDAPGRAVHDDLIPAARAVTGSYDRSTLLAIDAALALRVGERPSSLAAWRQRPFVASGARSAPAGSRFGARQVQRSGLAPPARSQSGAPVHYSALAARPPVAAGRARRESGRSRPLHAGPKWVGPVLTATLLVTLLTWLDAGILRSSEDTGDTPYATPEQLIATESEDVVRPQLSVDDPIDSDDVELVATASKIASPSPTPAYRPPPPLHTEQQSAEERQAALGALRDAGVAESLRTPASAQPTLRTLEEESLAQTTMPDAPPHNFEAVERTSQLMPGVVRQATRNANTSQLSMSAGRIGDRATLSGSEARPAVVRHTMPSAVRGVTRKQTQTEFADPLSSGGQGPAMVLLPPGSFQMGCGPGRECFDNEMPLRDVDVNWPIALSKFEITYDDYGRFTRATGRSPVEIPASWEHGDWPVVNVAWGDAVDYTVWLADETGRDYRLPTEAEWEYAARARTETEYHWGNKPGNGLANCTGCSASDTDWGPVQVGSFDANPWGLFDVHGNVWEWVADCGNGLQFGHRSMASLSAADCPRRVRRGGSWVHSPQRMRSASRDVTTSQLRSLDTGFRVLLQLE